MALAAAALASCGLPGAVYAQSAATPGLLAHYAASNGATLDRTDASVNFDWVNDGPASGFPTDHFTATWDGEIIAPVTGDYTFATTSDDGIRLSIDNQLLVSDYTDHGATTDTAPFTLHFLAGTLHRVHIDYYENTGQAVAKLLWSYPGQSRQPIPAAYLQYAPTLPAPSGLTATGAWGSSGSSLSGANVVLAWPAVSGAASYNVFRDGLLWASGIAGCSYADAANLLAGEGHTYAVCAVDGSGVAGALSANVTAAAAYPTPAGTRPAAAFGPPSNLRLQGVWSLTEGAQTDYLVWDPVPSAIQYNIYQYGNLIGTTTQPYYAVPAAQWKNGETYTVSATASCGMCESLPSNIVTAQGAVAPGGSQSGSPVTPTSLIATPEWNAGAPRVHLTWIGHANDNTYNIYRDGVLLERGLWGLNWYDNFVAPGESHTYTVTGISGSGSGMAESAPSSAITATALAAAPSPVGTPVQITSVTPEDDGLVVAFAAVPGAADYRVYNVNTPNSVKYSGGSLSIEFNGVDPQQPTTFVVEALDKLGPFQKMDGSMGPGSMDMNGGMHVNTNGQGDPSNVPNVIAVSAQTAASCTARNLTGAQAFFDNFRSDSPFVSTTPPAALASANGNWVTAVQNNNWDIYNVCGDLVDTQSFLMGEHFMDTLYDGGTPGGGNPMHTQNATLVMKPHATASIANGGVLHVTFEVDGHFDNRRWCEVWVADASDPLLVPGKFADNNQLPTASGQIFRWQIEMQQHVLSVFQGMDSNKQLIRTDLVSNSDRLGACARVTWDNKPVYNGTMFDLDKRHRYDLYLSQTRCQIYENGTLCKDAVFPSGVSLPFTNAQVYFMHQLYHSANDRFESLSYHQNETYWINNRPWADERHWDNMGFEVVSGFPGGN